MRIISVLVALICMCSTFAFGAEEIKLSGGSTSIVSIINPIKEPFQKTTGIIVFATEAGSKIALQKLDAGEVEVATAAHTKDELFGVVEKDKIQLKNKDRITVVQLAEAIPYAIIVNPGNPVSKLTKEQLAGIYSGKITNWKDVGGKDAHILCIVSNLSPGTNDLFSKAFLDGKKISVDTLEASTAIDLRQNVASNPEAIGFLAASVANASVKSIETPPMKSKPVILMTLGQPSPRVQKLIDFIKTEGPKYIK